MSSLLKKFTGDTSDTRNSRKDYDLGRDFLPQQTAGQFGESYKTNLCSDVEITGTISFKDSLRLDGKFEGEVRSSGTFIVGQNGEVKADIQVTNLVVEGKIEGNVIAEDRVELRSSAQLFGDVKAARLIIHEGVAFVGRCDVNPGEKTQTSSEATSTETEQTSY